MMFFLEAVVPAVLVSLALLGVVGTLVIVWAIRVAEKEQKRMCGGTALQIKRRRK